MFTVLVKFQILSPFEFDWVGARVNLNWIYANLVLGTVENIAWLCTSTKQSSVKYVFATIEHNWEDDGVHFKWIVWDVYFIFILMHLKKTEWISLKPFKFAIGNETIFENQSNMPFKQIRIIMVIN